MLFKRLKILLIKILRILKIPSYFLNISLALRNIPADKSLNPQTLPYFHQSSSRLISAENNISFILLSLASTYETISPTNPQYRHKIHKEPQKYTRIIVITFFYSFRWQSLYYPSVNIRRNIADQPQLSHRRRKKDNNVSISTTHLIAQNTKPSMVTRKHSMPPPMWWFPVLSPKFTGSRVTDWLAGPRQDSKKLRPTTTTPRNGGNEMPTMRPAGIVGGSGSWWAGVWALRCGDDVDDDDDKHPTCSS